MQRQTRLSGDGLSSSIETYTQASRTGLTHWQDPKAFLAMASAFHRSAAADTNLGFEKPITPNFANGNVGRNAEWSRHIRYSNGQCLGKVANCCKYKLIGMAHHSVLVSGCYTMTTQL